ncbi:hypothetical protein PVK06_044708 [Gossypium arboreum]|uniref:Uncharacterized protein n=1 Tax=Gossypium arboreum TaxID=29729 RepID=A0ABR0MSE0_GOSAR|nr:hypothetical protein PVK06_044708 [Gossypium arboreum]
MFNVQNTYTSMSLSYTSEQLLVPTELEDSGSNCEGSTNTGGIYLDFKPYAPPTHMHNVNLDTECVLEFLELLHRRLDYASSSLNVDNLQIGMEFSS